MTMPTNAHRTMWADATLKAFRNLSGDPDRGTALVDLLADLMHWADANSFDFEFSLAQARDHHAAEQAPRSRDITGM